MTSSSGGGLSKSLQNKFSKFAKTWSDLETSSIGQMGISFDMKDIATKTALKDWRAQITENMKKSLAAAIPSVKNALDEALESPVWSWSDGGTRDIIDTGALKDSAVISVNDFGFIVSYTMPYAAIVHYGGVTRNGFIYPARPWVQSVMVGGGPISPINWKEVLVRTQ